MFEDKFKYIESTTRDCDSGCKTTEYKEIDVTVPITIEPYACLGDACVEIIDAPCIIPIPRCMRKHNCQYAVKQKLCVIFPIEFNAVASSGPPICSIGDNCDCEEFVSNEIKDKIKEKIKDKIRDLEEEKKAESKNKPEFKKLEVRKPQKEKPDIKHERGLININDNTDLKKVVEIKKNEDELETLFSYKKLGNYLQILL